MTGRSSDGASFLALRVVLTAVVAVDLLTFYAFIGEARADALAAGSLVSSFIEFLSRPAVRGVVVVIGMAAAIAFGRRPGRLWPGLLALAALTLLSTAHSQLFGSPWRHLFFSGLCLAGWLLGLAVARYQGDPTRESYACTGSIALLAAAYFSSGISKIVYGGLTWLSGLPVQSAIVAQNGLVSDGIAAAYRSWVVTTPAVASVFSTATAALELAAPLMLFGRKARLLVAMGLFAMHANIYVLTTHILYWESMAFLLAFGLSAHPASPERAPGTAVSFGPRDRRFAAAVALLAVCAFFAIGHQARRNAQSLDDSPKLVEPIPASAVQPVAGVNNSAGPGERPLPAATVAVLRQVGPFAVGQSLTERWSIDSFDLSDDGFTMTILGEPGRARFRFTCAGSADRGPFDVGPAHILYSQHVDFRDLEAAGRALQEQFRKATEGQEVCERLLSWRTAVQAELSD